MIETPPPAPKRPRGRKRRAVTALALVVLVVPLMAVAAVIWAASERTILVPVWAIERLQAGLNADMGDRGRFDLDAVGVGLDLDQRKLRMHLIKGRFFNAEGRPVGRLQEAILTIDALAALRGEVNVRSLELTGGSLRVRRLPNGEFDVAFGRGDQDIADLPDTLGDALRVLDAWAVDPTLARLISVSASDLTILFSDELTGRRLALRDGRLAILRRAEQSTLVLGINLPGYGADGSDTKARLSLTHSVGSGATMQAQFEDVPVAELAQAFGPQMKAGLLETRVSGAITATADALGEISQARAQLSLGPGQVAGVDAARFDAARLALRYDPALRRVEIEEAEISSDQLRVGLSGQALFGPTLADPVAVQVAARDLWLDPDGLFAEPVQFERGVFEGRVHLAPFRLEIGQAHIGVGDEGVTVQGQIALGDDGMRGSVEVSSPNISAAKLQSLWPPALVPKTRAWVARSITDGRFVDLAGAVRFGGFGTPPKATASFGIKGAEVRFMANLPPVSQADGAGQIHEGRLTFRVDRGHVDSGAFGPVDLSGTHFTIPDVLQKPVTGEVDLALQGPIPAVLTVLDNKPFDVLKRADRPATLAFGQARVAGRISVPLVRKPDPALVEVALSGTLSDVRSDTLVPGRQLSARRLDIDITADQIAISGDANLDEVALRMRWQQAMVQAGGAPPGSTLTGSLPVDSDVLQALGVNLGDGVVAGTTRAQFRIDMARGVPGQLTVESDLKGVRLSLPALGWRKSEQGAGALEARVTLSNPPQITRLSLDTTGLVASGQITLAPGGGIDVARFDRVRLGGWLDAPVRLTGQGPGRPLRVAILGGQADLRRANLGAGGAGGSSANSPISFALDRLILSEGIVLTAMTGELTQTGGLSGTFDALLNGRAAIRGTMVPSANGAAVRVLSRNAGAVLSAAGVFENATGGALDLTLFPVGGEGRYNGQMQINDIRLRNAPGLASLLSAISVVGLLDQLAGEGIVFNDVTARFELRPGDIRLLEAAAVGPSMGLSADGVVDLGSGMIDVQGVVSPLYVVNGLLGGLFARRREGLIGINYTLSGPTGAPRVQVNPLSILTPGVFRDIFRRPPPARTQ